jgi:protein-tyrosine-phosphatase
VQRVTASSWSPDVSPPSFVRLAGHPLRWRLLSELGRSDRQVRELCALIGRPQSLVSYHLGRLRAQGLVSMRRSSADRRDVYYNLDLALCAQSLSASGGALHPGLRLAQSSSSAGRPRFGGARPRVLFLCTGNSARSQMAEALVEQLAGGAIEVFSAGSHPKPLHPNAVRAMREHGIDIAGRRSKPLGEFTQQRWDYVISLCDRVREVCPEFPARPDLIHWSIPDPAREGETDAQTYPAFQRTATELATRIPFLLELIEHTQATQEAN